MWLRGFKQIVPWRLAISLLAGPAPKAGRLRQRRAPRHRARRVADMAGPVKVHLCAASPPSHALSFRNCMHVTGVEDGPPPS